MQGAVLCGRYHIIKDLGEGGFSRTFLAEDRGFEEPRVCVVKQLRPHTKDPKILETARRLFNQEAQILHRLGSHDQIPRLLAHFEEDGEFFLVQEFIEGKPVDLELAEAKKLTPSQGVTLLRELLEVLAYVHGQGVIHRDVKPANLIRRTSDKRIVLIDFGAVKQSAVGHVPTGQTNLTVAICSEGYTPSEQLAGRPQFSSDVYAAGMVAIQALTGISPAHLPQSRSGEIIWQDKAQVHPALASLLTQMVRFDFRQRFPSAREALDALRQVEAAVAGTRIETTPPLRPIATPPPQARPVAPVPTVPPRQGQTLVSGGPASTPMTATPFGPLPSREARPFFQRYRLEILAGSGLLVLATSLVLFLAFGVNRGEKEAVATTARVADSGASASGDAGTEPAPDDQWYERGLTAERDAKIAALNAKSGPDWAAVATKWREASICMQNVHPNSPKYPDAQVRLPKYQAEERAAVEKAVKLGGPGVATNGNTNANTGAAPSSTRTPRMPRSANLPTYIALDSESLEGPTLYTQANGTITAWFGSQGSSVNISYSGPEALHIHMGAGDELSPGTYSGAGPARTPKLHCSSRAFSCSSYAASGTFTVLRLDKDEEGDVLLFEATFELHCDTGQSVYGRVRYENF